MYTYDGHLVEDIQTRFEAIFISTRINEFLRRLLSLSAIIYLHTILLSRKKLLKKFHKTVHIYGANVSIPHALT